ncbi:cobalamin biosynthesis protein [Pontibacterium sp. N1Y112]|uniref:Cobalamin biosynthesis protein n=1 Tax=Pontibacterium sinense TaxID=2781979 RepID=A0A8J7K076_9GAMM|nr:cobalamin biosynthesis protein [Pontibacterium sinense]MBE9399648.1 cobalamin biosynthesis protein [Pontibacterium sinense]
MSKIIALTDAGHRLALRLNTEIKDSEVWFKPKPFTESVQQAFRDGEALIFICATGIVMRMLAPVIEDKRQDPPVLVLDELGQYVIPLLSGHEGGANDWAAQVADMLSAQAVITTAKPYLQPVYSVGMGCERHCPVEELERLLEQCLSDAGLTLDHIQSLNSIDIKADEVGLIELARKLGKPYQTWDAQQLGSMDGLLSTRSEYVFNTVGVYGVAESAALYAAQQATGQAPELVLNKQKTRKATCAIARSYPA